MMTVHLDETEQSTLLVLIMLCRFVKLLKKVLDLKGTKKSL